MQNLAPVTSAWLTEVLRASGYLPHGAVVALNSVATEAFNSATQRLELNYSADAPADRSNALILKRNIREPWAIEAGAAEVAFYQFVAALDPTPPAIVPCYAAAYDPTSGDSYLLLQDLSATHAPPITRDQQISIVHSVPSADAINQVIDTLARQHAYWWQHASLSSGRFEIGYWTRNAERFMLYLQRRRAAWDDLIAHESDWFPQDLRELYASVLDGLEHHWQRDIEPRFRNNMNLTLIHGDSYFTNFLVPKGSSGETYLIDWQSPCVDIAGYDLANLLATFWTSEQRHEHDRERAALRRYHDMLLAHDVRNYTWEDLVADYQIALIGWLLVPLQDRHDGSPRDYWWPKMQCTVAAFRDWRCDERLG